MNSITLNPIAYIDGEITLPGSKVFPTEHYY